MDMKANLVWVAIIRRLLLLFFFMSILVLSCSSQYSKKSILKTKKQNIRLVDKNIMFDA